MGSSAAAAALFVYGTLRPAGPAHRRLGRVVRVAAASMPGLLYRMLGGYPVLVEGGARGARVRGEVCWVADAAATLRALDAYEGVRAARGGAGEYVRVRRAAELPDGSRLEAWAYVAAPAAARRARREGRRLPGGEWPGQPPVPRAAIRSRKSLKR